MRNSFAQQWRGERYDQRWNGGSGKTGGAGGAGVLNASGISPGVITTLTNKERIAGGEER